MAEKPNAAGERNATFFDSQRNRWYRPDPANPTKTYPGVTSILNSRNKGGLEGAKRNGIINYVADNREQLATLNKGVIKAVLKDQDELLPDWKVGREYGTAVHTVMENCIMGRDPEFGLKHVEGTPTYPVSNTFTEWVPKVWAEFNEKYNFELHSVEKTVISEKHRYAGSYDIMGTMDALDGSGKRVMTLLDTKSNAKGPHGDVALQLAAYGNADFIIDTNTGEKTALPKVEQTAVLWLHENPALGGGEPGWNLHPLRFDAEVFKWFYGHLMVFACGLREHELIGQAHNGPERWKRYIPRG